MTDLSKTYLDLSTASQITKPNSGTSDENSTGTNEEGSGTNQIGDIIKDLQSGYLQILTRTAHTTSSLESWLNLNASQVSPSEKQQLLSVLAACLRQSAFTTGLLQQYVERLRSPIMIAKKF